MSEIQPIIFWRHSNDTVLHSKLLNGLHETIIVMETIK